MNFADADWWTMVAATIAALHVEEGYPLTTATVGPMLYRAREVPGTDAVALRTWLRAQPKPAPLPVPAPPPVPPPPVPPPPIESWPAATREDGIALVTAVKADLVRRGVSLAGPCGAFEITRRVAWLMRSQGAGLLEKLGGNRCQDRSTDIIAFPDGAIVDILIAGGGDEGPDGQPVPGTGNVPSWQTGNAPVDPNRWKAPIDPGDGTP